MFFHYAAVVGVNRTLDNPIKVLEDIKGLENIFKLSVSNKIKRIFFLLHQKFMEACSHAAKRRNYTFKL